ncbi:hypothetical protein FPSE5266_20131 [Fusarium pseudograminearum]|nr:hypothetical protein FPSE5266_20131 [Fusarium pseudograminearum]
MAGAVVPSRSGCNVLKLERPFAFKAGRKPSSRQKGKQVTQPVENDPEEEGDDEPHKYLKKYRASEITRDDIQFLTEDAENAAEDPGGCLIKYVSRQSALDNIVFEQVVADEAHNAKNPNGIYNHMLNLGEHRKDILTSFDFRSNRILNPDEPVIYGSPDEFKEAVKAIKDPNLKRTSSQLELEKKREAKETSVVMDY